jgi:thioredoxin 1
MSSNLQAVDGKTFGAFTSQGEAALLDFWAPWCGPCKALAPVLDDLAAQYGARMSVGKVNVDEAPELAAQFGVRGIPTLVLFKNGQAVSQQVGVQSREKLREWIDATL